MLCVGMLLHINNQYAQSSWQTYQTPGENGIKIYAQNGLHLEYSEPVICNFSQDVQAEYIFLRLTNYSDSPMNISFRVDHFYQGSGCATCTNDEYQYSFKIPAHGVLTGDCNFTTTGLSKLAIFKKFINKKNSKEFDKFEISNIVIQ